MVVVLSMLGAVVAKSQTACDDVGGHVADGAIGGKGVSSNPDQGLVTRDVQLHSHHPGSLVGLGAVCNCVVERIGQEALWGSVLQAQYRLGQYLREGDAVDVLRLGEIAFASW